MTEQKSEVQEHIVPYFNFCDEIGIVDVVLLKGNRIIIPVTLRKEVLRQLHLGQFGIEKLQHSACGSVYWPQINKDIETMIRQCAPCQIMQKSQCKEPLKPHDIPPFAWHNFGLDVFFFQNISYLYVKYYYSKLPVIWELYNQTAEELI